MQSVHESVPGMSKDSRKHQYALSRALTGVLGVQNEPRTHGAGYMEESWFCSDHGNRPAIKAFTRPLQTGHALNAALIEPMALRGIARASVHRDPDVN